MKSRTFKLYPYKNWWLIVALNLSVLACLLSWVWSATFAFSFVTTMLFQSLWFWRQNKSYLIAYSVLAILAGAMSTYTGIYVQENWKNSTSCLAFFRVDDLEDDAGKCHQMAFVYISFASAALWFTASSCLIAFMASGGHSKLEAKWNTETTSKDSNSVDSSIQSDSDHSQKLDDTNNTIDISYTTATSTCLSSTDLDKSLPLTINTPSPRVSTKKVKKPSPLETSRSISTPVPPRVSTKKVKKPSPLTASRSISTPVLPRISSKELHTPLPPAMSRAMKKSPHTPPRVSFIGYEQPRISQSLHHIPTGAEISKSKSTPDDMPTKPQSTPCLGRERATMESYV